MLLATNQVGFRARPALIGLPHQLAEIIVNDPKVRRFCDLQLIRSVRPRDPLARLRVLEHADLVPRNPPNIKLVEHEAIATLSVSLNRGRIPKSPARWQYVLPIEILGNGTRR